MADSNARAERGGGKATDLSGPTDAYRIQYQWGSNGNSQGIVQGNGADWFGPLNPMNPVAPLEVLGRQLDFPSGYNLELAPRAYEPVKFADMRGLADSYDLLRLLIETRKDQMERQTWTIRPKTKANGEDACDPEDPVIEEIYEFLQFPDGDKEWGPWLRAVLEDMLVIDAASIYCHTDRGGKLLGLEQLDGATVKRVINDWGRTPEPPIVAYQQILKGFPALNYTTDQLIYAPRNMRVHKFYGYSPVEQVIMTVNIALRRQVFQLQYYTEGNIPEALVGTPDLWTPKQVQDFQTAFDAMLSGQTANRRKIKFVPGGVAKTFIPTKEVELTGKTDEWLARVCCFAFSISPQAFVAQMNRATAESAQNAAIEEGLVPVQAWIKRIMDKVIRRFWNRTDIEFTWEDDREVDQKVQADVLTRYTEAGIIEINEAREELGKEPAPEGKGLRVKTSTGYVLVAVNDDAPTAGEAHEAGQVAAQANLDAKTELGHKALDQKAEAGADPKEDKEDAEKGAGLGAKAPFVSASGPSASPSGRSLAKARRLKGITNRTNAVKYGEDKLYAALRRGLSRLAAQAGEIARAHLGIAKASGDDNPAAPIAADAIVEGVDWAILVNATEEELRRVALDGAKRALLVLGVSDDVSIVSQTYTRAEEWARLRAAELVGMKYNALGELIPNPDASMAITDTLRSEIRAAVADAIEQGLPAAELATNIEEVAGFTADRALMVARTEIIRANNNGHMAAFAASGVVTQKEWSTAEDGDTCEVCQGNADQGPIGLNDDFDSGDSEPPGHPNCRCTLVPVVEELSEEETTGGDDEE